jgi:hypothetical protein
MRLRRVENSTILTHVVRAGVGQEAVHSVLRHTAVVTGWIPDAERKVRAGHRNRRRPEQISSRRTPSPPFRRPVTTMRTPSVVALETSCRTWSRFMRVAPLFRKVEVPASSLQRRSFLGMQYARSGTQGRHPPRRHDYNFMKFVRPMATAPAHPSSRTDAPASCRNG